MGKSSARKKKAAAAAVAADVAVAADAATASIAPTTTATTTTTSTATSANGTAAASSLLRRAHELKEEGNRLFQAKDYAAALRHYALALDLTPPNHPDRAVFHSNRAACLMLIRPVDHHAVAAECSLALQSQPLFPRALLRRARALEALKRFDLALLDVQSLLAIDSSNRDALDLAERLRLAISQSKEHTSAVDPGSRPSPAALGASAVRVGAPVSGLGPCLPARPKKSTTVNKTVVPQLNNQTVSSASLPNGNHSKPEHQVNVSTVSRLEDVSVGKNLELDGSKESGKGKGEKEVGLRVSPPPVVTQWRPLKLVYDHDIRLAQMPVNCSFKVLREIVGKKFPSSKAVLIKYKDDDGDLVTVTSTAELRLAESSVDQVQKTENKDEVLVDDKNKKLQALRLHVVEVNAEQEPEVPEEEEEKPVEDSESIKADDNLLNGDSVLDVLDSSNDVAKSSSEEDNSKKEKCEHVKKECNHAECKEVEIDDWLLDFAQLFRTQVGIDPDAHLDLHELGMELCSEALEETVTSEEAQGLFEMAAAKFQEVAALAFFNWGNVHMCAARKRIPLDESAPKEVLSAQLQKAYDWVQERYALAGQKYEEALRIKPDFYEGLLALGQQQFETAKLHWSFALAEKVDLLTWDSSETIKLFNSAEEKMNAATEMWEKVEEQRIAELKDPGMSKKDEVLRKRKKQGAADVQGELSADEAAEQAAVMRSQIHLFWGNMLFERSQVEFKLGNGNWKKNIDAAVERFKLAGASEADISVVLKNHASNETETTAMILKDHTSNGNDVACDEKEVTTSCSGAWEVIAEDEDKHVLES